jgi:hypothetical protein
MPSLAATGRTNSLMAVTTDSGMGMDFPNLVLIAQALGACADLGSPEMGMTLDGRSGIYSFET